MVVLRSYSGWALVLVFFGILFALSYNNSLFHGVSGSLRRSTRMAVHEGLLTAGVVAGSAIAGILYQGGRFSRVVVFGSTVVASAAAVQVLLVLLSNRLSTRSAD
jgi:predicted MFS family arabinose efflux permease